MIGCHIKIAAAQWAKSPKKQSVEVMSRIGGKKTIQTIKAYIFNIR